MPSHRSEQLRRNCTFGLICALAFLAVATIRIPVVAFLKYEPKDVFLAIGGFIYGPLAGIYMSIVVALIEMVTVSDTGLIGFAMNVLSSCLFVGISAAIYHKRKSMSRAIVALIAGALATAAGMMLWNYLITPLYMHIPRQDILPMLLPIFLPFNLLKGGLNATLTVVLYKGVVTALRTARLLPPADVQSHKKASHTPWLIGLFVLSSLILVLLAWKGII